MEKNEYKSWFLFILLYLIIVFGRPQEIMPWFGDLRPALIVTSILSLYLFFRGPLSASFSKQTTMFLLFIGLLALYIPFAKNHYLAFQTVYTMLLFVPFVLSTIVCVNSIDRLKKIIFVAVCLMVFVSLYSLMHTRHVYGNYFNDENDLALYINMWLPFCYFLFLNEKDRLMKYFYLSGLIIGVLTVISTFSRGGFVGMLCVGFACWMKSSRKIVSLLVIILIAVMILFIASDKYWQRIETTTDLDQGTAAGRLESWKAAWAMFVDRPWGVGGNNFPARFEEYQTSFFTHGMWGRVAHSLWFTLLPETGVVGIVIYLLLLKYNIKDIRFLSRRTSQQNNADLKYMNALCVAFVASMVGFFSSGTFLSVLYYPHYWYLTGIIVATVKIAKHYEIEPDPGTVGENRGITTA